MPTRPPQLCVVVLSFQNDDTIVAAVDSLLSQSEAAELVVSHSGYGRTLDLLARRFPGLPVIGSANRRSPGAARNAGVAATRAPYIAFLAADCIALPGWVAGRTRRHAAGARAVASAMAAPPGGPALAAHLLQHGTRMPHLAARPSLRFGVSYERGLLLRLGGFREDLPGEEDVRLNARLLAAGVEIAWAPEVLTAHSYPRTARGLLADQYRRGRMRHEVRGARRPRPVLAGRALLDGPASIRNAARRGSAVHRGALLGAAPLVAMGAVATAAGIVGERRAP